MSIKKSEMGSVTLEATISVSMALMVIIVMLGTLFSIYLNEGVNQIALGATSELQVLSIPFYEDENIAKRFAKEMTLEQISFKLIKSELEKKGLNPYVEIDYIKSISETRFEAGGIFNLAIHYRLKIPCVKKDYFVAYPVLGIARGDGVQFQSETVYITNTGEKHHIEACHHLRLSKIAIDIEEAEKRGYEPCKNCHKK